LVPLVISFTVHVGVVGIGELLSPQSGTETETAPRVSYQEQADAGPPPSNSAPERTGDKPAPQGTISLETSDPRYKPYFAALRESIEISWKTPEPGEGESRRGKLTVVFTIDSRGGLLDISVKRSSGVRALDFAAVEAVKEAAPFRPFPAEFTEEKISVRARFVYD